MYTTHYIYKLLSQQTILYICLYLLLLFSFLPSVDRRLESSQWVPLLSVSLHNVKYIYIYNIQFILWRTLYKCLNKKKCIQQHFTTANITQLLINDDIYSSALFMITFMITVKHNLWRVVNFAWETKSWVMITTTSPSAWMWIIETGVVGLAPLESRFHTGPITSRVREYRE